VSRRSTPERINEAREAATRSRLIGDGLSEPTAEAWIAAWEAAAARDGVERGSTYWTAAWEWIKAERLRGRRPSS
jgi:hypothetical protein